MWKKVLWITCAGALLCGGFFWYIFSEQPFSRWSIKTWLCLSPEMRALPGAIGDHWRFRIQSFVEYDDSILDSGEFVSSESGEMTVAKIGRLLSNYGYEASSLEGEKLGAWAAPKSGDLIWLGRLEKPDNFIVVQQQYPK